MFVAYLMTRGLAEIDWDDITQMAPAVVTAVAMPLTFSIATGIGLGFICYVGIKLLAGRVSRNDAPAFVVAVAFMVKFSLV